MGEDQRQGRTNYDWVNGMRVGILVGGIAGIALGWVTGIVPFILLLAGAAIGGVVGAKLANRW